VSHFGAPGLCQCSV